MPPITRPFDDRCMQTRGCRISLWQRSILLLFAFVTAGSCQQVTGAEGRPWFWQGPTMGTSYSIKLVAPSNATISQADLATQVDALLRRINDQMSTYVAESEVSRFNRTTAGEWFEVSPATAQVVQQALDIGKQSGNAYDITVGPLVRLWHFGPQSNKRQPPGQRATEQLAPPAPEAIQATLQRVGAEHLQVRVNPPALRKTIDDLEIDLSSIAKGFAVDRIAAMLEDHAIGDYMVEIGGEVRTHGRRQDTRPWQIGIERPNAENRRVQRIVPLRDLAIATSGDYRIFFETDGQRYSHLLDPRTGRPVAHRLASVSVLAESCTQADALATTLLVLGPEEGFAWSLEHKVAALFMFRRVGPEGNGEIVQQATPRFEQLTAGESEQQTMWPTLLLLTAVVFSLALIGMAIGVIFSNRCLRGSCGGLGNLRDAQGRTLCDGCTNPSPDCQGDPLREKTPETHPSHSE